MVHRSGLCIPFIIHVGRENHRSSVASSYHTFSPIPSINHPRPPKSIIPWYLLAPTPAISISRIARIDTRIASQERSKTHRSSISPLLRLQRCNFCTVNNTSTLTTGQQTPPKSSKQKYKFCCEIRPRRKRHQANENIWPMKCS
ncbi:hypothetical protein VTL71DRAFT_6145 [Oculimacula yallundae]|uniref:Uncharacterized protein n=1 Tax=Oculimacula yallundae TaxID=86028 RepID=A0ABR4BZJ9_9HELO